MLNSVSMKNRPFGQGLCYFHLLVALFLFIPGLLWADFTAEYLEDYGYVSLIGVQGNYDADGPAAEAAIARQEITKAFYSVHDDIYDFIVIFTDFDFQLPPQAKAFYMGVINDTEGIGRNLFDNSVLYGSNGVLLGANTMISDF